MASLSPFHFLILLVGFVILSAVVVGIVFLVKAVSKPTNPPPMPADWYPDPGNPELLRYFDGRSWTEATHPRAAPPGS